MRSEYQILAEAESMQKQLVEWRRALHQNPEVGMSLPETMAFLKGELDDMGVAYQSFDEISCILASVGSGKRCFLLRSDVDALPIREETALPFRAVNGCMHACGHDLHGAVLLGAARLLKGHEGLLNGTVKMLFQSGEECFQGAKAAVEAGVLECPRVEAALSLHVLSTLPEGMILTGKEVTASVDGFQITLIGQGGHGSAPEHCVDPINAAVQVYLALQSLIARETGGTEEAVLTVGSLTSGETANAIPERAVLKGTLRTFRDDVRHRLNERVREMASRVASAYRCCMEYELLFECPGVVTDDVVTSSVIRGVELLLPGYQLSREAHGMGSEDFAQITQCVPSAYLMLGAASEGGGERYAMHNPKVEFNESVLSRGAAIYATAAMEWVK